MNYGSIYSEICTIVYGDTTEPTSVNTRLHGTNGLIARKRKRLLEKENLWFMEKSRQIYIAEGVTDYDITFGFKEEITLRFSDSQTGNYYDPLTKIKLTEIDRVFKDYDQTSKYPKHYYLDWNGISGYRQLRLFPIPAEMTYTVDLSTGTTPEAIANTAFSYVIDGTSYDKVAVAAGTAFTAADTINTAAAASVLWGVWLIQINSAGTISTKPGGGLSDQVYTSELNAINALPQADSGNWPVGYVTVANNSGAAWTANTDDLTAGSDAYDVNYYNITSLLNFKYWEYLDDLSSVDATFDATEDQISIQCPELIVWACVKELAEVEKNIELIQLAQNNIQNEYQAIIEKNFKYRNANIGRIPHRSL